MIIILSYAVALTAFYLFGIFFAQVNFPPIRIPKIFPPITVKQLNLSDTIDLIKVTWLFMIFERTTQKWKLTNQNTWLLWILQACSKRHPVIKYFLNLNLIRSFQTASLSVTLRRGSFCTKWSAREYQLRHHCRQRADNDPGQVWKQGQTIHFT